MEIDVTKLSGIRPWPKDKKWIDMSDEIGYFFLLGLLTPKETKNIILSVMNYAVNGETKFEFNNLEFVLFCKILMDNGCITDYSFKCPNYDK